MKPENPKFRQGYRQKEAALQDHSHQIPIHQMTVWLCQDHYFSSPSRQVGSKERRLPHCKDQRINWNTNCRTKSFSRFHWHVNFFYCLFFYVKNTNLFVTVSCYKGFLMNKTERISIKYYTCS